MHECNNKNKTAYAPLLHHVEEKRRLEQKETAGDDGMHAGQTTTHYVTATGPTPSRLPEGTTDLCASYG